MIVMSIVYLNKIKNTITPFQESAGISKMDRVRVLLFIFFLVLLMADAETIEVREAMVQFMEKLSPGIIRNETNWGWNKSSDPCTDGWKGVTCYNNTLTIKRIVLNELNLTGVLDAGFLCVTRALVVLSLKSNTIVGTLPDEISKCRRLTHIYLHGNNFIGNLPESLSRLSNLKRLDVSNNGFSGFIPNLSRISSLLTFLAENNKLSGGIPEFDFSNLEQFNVSYNNLSGQIPNVDGRFNVSSFLGNPELCGNPVTNACPPPPPPAPKKNNRFSSKDYLMYSGYAAIGLIIVCLIAFKVSKKCKIIKNKNTTVAKRGFQTDSTDEKISSRMSSDSKVVGENRSEFSITSVESGKCSSSLTVLCSPVVNVLRFEDLLRSPAELIGRGKRGSLYKVTLNEEVILAVKRIRDWDISMDDFKKRMQLINQVKHPNLMPIVAFYCSSQEKLLVYEFQQNGSLFKLLHGSQNGQSFNWESRLTISSKIADALACMHEKLQPESIPHGNLKSSNILLSQEMEPLISEYGLAVIENRNRSFHIQTDRFQENASRNNENAFQADVYSFGVILLELLTGNLVQNKGFDLAKWINSAIREEWTVEVFDKSLVSEGASEERMLDLLQVALKCIDSPSETRPRIREIADMIKSIKELEEKSICSDPC